MGVGKKLKEWKQQDHLRCPRCRQTEEDAKHVIMCPSLSASAQWEISITNFTDSLKEIDTSPPLQQALLAGLLTIRGRLQMPPTHFHLTYNTFRHQARISWTPLVLGFISDDWQVLQQQYLSGKSSQKTGKRWAIAIHKKLLAVSWDMWCTMPLVRPRRTLSGE